MTNLYDIGTWYEDKGLVGEKKLAITQTTIAVSGKHMGFMLIAPAGSGKTVVMDLLVGDKDSSQPALLKKEFIYFKDAGSETSFWYDADEINRAKIIVFKELQKDSSTNTIEAIKSLTEGKSANRKVTVAVEDRTKNQKLDPKTVLGTYAVENTSVNFDTELARRCVTMATDISKTQTEDVLTLKAKLRWDKESSRTISDKKSAEIHRDVNSLLTMTVNVVNPFAEEFSKVIAEIAPDQKVRSMAEHFWDVMEGVAKINANIDTVFVSGDTMIVNIQDLYQTLDIYKASFLRDVHSIPPLGDIILVGFEDAKSVDETLKISKENKGNFDLAKFGTDVGINEWFDVNHIRKAIKLKQNVVLAKNVVTQICRQLVDSGYLEDWKDDRVIKYQVQEKFSDFTTPDFNILLDSAKRLVEQKYPTQYDKWLKNQYKSYQHPINGEIIEISTVTGTILDDEELI